MCKAFTVDAAVAAASRASGETFCMGFTVTTGAEVVVVVVPDDAESCG